MYWNCFVSTEKYKDTLKDREWRIQKLDLKSINSSWSILTINLEKNIRFKLKVMYKNGSVR